MFIVCYKFKIYVLIIVKEEDLCFIVKEEEVMV